MKKAGVSSDSQENHTENSVDKMEVLDEISRPILNKKPNKHFVVNVTQGCSLKIQNKHCMLM